MANGDAAIMKLKDPMKGFILVQICIENTEYVCWTHIDK